MEIDDIVENKNAGYRRPSPQSAPIPAPRGLSVKKRDHILPCTECGKQFSKESHLKTHMKCHESQSGSHACSQCSKTFNNKRDLDIHTKRHEDGDYTCNNCDFEGNSREALAKHMETKHTIRSKPTCKFCGLEFTFRYQLTNHILENHGSHKPCTNFAKNRCEFDNECRFKHITLAEGQYICYTCGQMYNNKTSLMKHIEEEHGSIPCNKYAAGKCTYGNKCLYKHDGGTQEPDKIMNNKTQGFHKHPPTTDPPTAGPPNWPSLPPQDQQNNLSQITTMMTLMEQNITILKNMVKNMNQ